MEGCTGWRYVAGELAAAGIAAHVGEPADTAFARGRKRHAKTDKTDSRHLRELLAEGRLPECWIPPEQVLECRALLETYHDLRREHTAWVQRIHAVFFHQGAPPLGEAAVMAPVHPGEILLEEFLRPLAVSQYKLAKEIGVPARRINEIVHGQRRISADTALRLARFFGTSERFWINLQARHDLETEKDRLGDALDGIRPLSAAS
jgi:addiction module HigA family antidote